MPIQRMTCFNVKNVSDIQGLQDQYNTVEQTNRKVRHAKYAFFPSAPYFVSGMQLSQWQTLHPRDNSRKAIEDPRNPGYNLIGITKFASMDDVKYYDEACEAHQKLKAFAKDKVDGPPLVLHVGV